MEHSSPRHPSATILGTGGYVPEKILTNEEIEQLTPGASARWTQEHLGIRQRHIAADGESTGDLAVVAARRALHSAHLSPKDLNLIIVCTTTPRRVAPSTACYVQHELGATECPAFDLAAVCSGFIYGLSVAAQFVTAGIYKHVLVVGADTFSKITDWSRRDCVFFGDGAGAVVVGPGRPGEGILSIDLGADGSEHDAWTVLAGGSAMPPSRETVDERLHYWKMDGRLVYEMAINRIPWTLGRSLKVAGLTLQDIDHVIPHQPSIQILKRSAEILGVPFSKFHVSMDRYANTSAASIPLTLNDAREAGRLQQGDNLAFIAVGAGWTWGSIILKWSLPG